MTTTLDISPTTTETRTVLTGVSWDAYERLLTETGAERHQRFAYDNEQLEIMDTQEQAYKVQVESIAFPGLPITEIPQFILKAKQDGQRSAIRAFRQAVQDAQKNGL